MVWELWNYGERRFKTLSNQTNKDSDLSKICSPRVAIIDATTTIPCNTYIWELIYACNKLKPNTETENCYDCEH